MTVSVTPWPPENLEVVPNCPVCGSARRDLLHAMLTDVTFFTAKGDWNLWRCGDCGSGYLDPRPDEASIRDAYASYYTHNEAEKCPTTSSSGLRNRLGNGYRNARFGARMEPSNPLGELFALFMPRLRRQYETAYRYLPRPRYMQILKVLDYGCGNGAYLKLIRESGLEAFGVEPDPISRSVARKSGADVRSTLDEFDGMHFDAVTVSHVIEHVHQPVLLLERLASVLPVGGHLFIETPNIDAIGHEIYGRHWRGIEAPRHLTIFSQSGLTRALRATGFDKITFRDVAGALEFTQGHSRKIAAGLDPYSSEEALDQPFPTEADYRTASIGPKAEFLSVTAVRT